MKSGCAIFRPLVLWPFALLVEEPISACSARLGSSGTLFPLLWSITCSSATTKNWRTGALSYKWFGSLFLVDGKRSKGGMVSTCSANTRSPTGPSSLFSLSRSAVVNICQNHSMPVGRETFGASLWSQRTTRVMRCSGK